MEKHRAPMWRVANVMFSVCGAAATVCLSVPVASGVVWENVRIPFLAGALLSFATLLYITLRHDFLKTTFEGLSIPVAVLSLAASAMAVYSYYPYFRDSLAVITAGNALLSSLYSRFFYVACGMCFLFAFVFLTRFYKKAGELIKRFSVSLDNIERRFLLFGFIGFGCLIVTAYGLTNAFYSPSGIGIRDGALIEFDVLFDADSGLLIKGNEYMMTFAQENDIRNIMFGLATMPFALLARLLSVVFSFAFDFAYPLFLSFIQMALLLMCDVLVCRMTGIKGKNRPLFLLAMSLSFPSLFAMLVLDQIAFGTVWLVLLIYFYVNGMKGRDALFIGAAGSIATSGIALPLISGPEKCTLKARLCDLARCSLTALGVFSVFGYIPYLVVFAIRRLSMWVGAVAGVPLTEKLLQFITFVQSCLIKPPSGLNTARYDFPIYCALPVNGVSAAGLVILICCAAGLFLNRKSRYARLCGAWAAFSVLVLVVVGWGAPWNCMSFYCWYFAWAYISLLFMFLDKVIKNERAKKLVFVVLAAFIAAYNLIGIADVVMFGMEYYPAI